MATPGYGVCGHKNAFTTGVKIGNYVEDRFGAQLAAVASIKPLARVSEAAASFIDPREMPRKSGDAPADDPTARDLLRAGLPYNLVFEHGTPHAPSCDELVLKYTPTSRAIGAALADRPITLPQDETRRRQRQLQRMREVREARHSYVTTAQAIVPATVQSPK